MPARTPCRRSAPILRAIRRRLSNIAFAAGLLLLAGAPASGQEGAAPAPLEVDLQLVLAVDVSGSVDPEEARLQREGYVAAFAHPDVMAAIAGGMLGRIAVAYVEWAGYGHRRVVLDWRIIAGPEDSRGFAEELASLPIGLGQRTSISGAIELAMPMFDDNGFESLRRVIDISGDGPNNDGPPVPAARDMAVARGITVNGLPIVNDRPNRFGFPTQADLDLYYEGCVIGGPGAFIVVAEDFESFAVAIRRKLLLEIAGLPPPAPAAQGLLRQAAYEPGCDIGERRSRDFMFQRFAPD